MAKQISASERSIAKIFCDEFEFHIPSYQRPYSWTTEQASDLFDDLLSHFDTDEKKEEGYFLGSIVLIKEETKPHSDVVDGQQRLTTLTILLASLANFLSENEQKELKTYFVEPGKKYEMIKNKERLTLRIQDKKFFNEYIQNLEINKLLDLPLASLDNESQKNIWANANHFTDKIKQRFGDETSDIDKFIEFILNRCFLVVVSTPNQESAFRIFTVMNSRGLDLQATDIIKADLIGDLDSGEQDEYSKKWEQMEEMLTRDGFNDLFTYIRMIYAKNKPKRSLREEFKDHVLKKNPDYKKLIDNVLEPYADALQIIRDKAYRHGDEKENKRINELIGWLNRIDNSDWMPPAILYLHLNKNRPAEVLEFFIKLERLAAFMQAASNVANIYLNQRIEIYARLIKDIEGNVGLDQMLTLNLDEEQKYYFYRALSGDIYKMAPKHRRYIMLRLDRFLADGGAIYDPSILTIEHVLPQTVEADSEWEKVWPNESDREEWLHKLGNLVLLSRRRNSKAQNYDFKTKCEKYFTGNNNVSSYALTTQVLYEDKWDVKTLKKRQAILLKAFMEGWQFQCDLDDFDLLKKDDDSFDHHEVISRELSNVPREDLDKRHDYMEQKFSYGDVPRRSSKISNIKFGETFEYNRLKIWKRLIGKDITLRIQYKNSYDVIEIKHDALIKIVKRIKPTAMQSESWIDCGEYHWPYIDREMRSELTHGGYLSG